MSEVAQNLVELCFCSRGAPYSLKTTRQKHLCAAAAQLMAKCETRQSLFNFQSIAQASDAIIMSRGNLGLDVLPEKMALVQKAVISNSNLIGKPVLITRVVDTMVNTPRPTRSAPASLVLIACLSRLPLLLEAHAVACAHALSWKHEKLQSYAVPTLSLSWGTPQWRQNICNRYELVVDRHG